MLSIGSRIRRNLSDPGSQHRLIAEGFLWVSLFVFLGKLAGAAKEAAIAWRFGVSATVDAYVFVLNLISWPVSVWFSILAIVLVPLAARWNRENRSELRRFRRELLAFTLFLGLGLGTLIWFGLPFLLVNGWGGLSGATLAQGLSMSRSLTLTLPLGLIAGLFSAWMMAGGRYKNTLLEAVPALVILLSLIMPPTWLSEPLVFGTVAGISLQVLALGWHLHSVGDFDVPVCHYRSPIWQGFWGGIGILSAGQLLTSFSGIVDQFLAVGLPAGALSTLNYANRILALVLGMGAMAISRVTLPVFSRARARGDGNVDSLALKWARWMYAGGIAVAAVGALLAPYLVQLLFERGAFTEDNTNAVSNILSWSFLQIPFYFSALVLVSALASGGHYWLIAISGATNLIVKICFALPLVKYFQLNGLVVSTAAMYAISLALLYLSVRLTSAKEKNTDTTIK